MHICRLIVIALTFSMVFSGMTVFAQENTTTDLCAGVTCNSPPVATCTGNSLVRYSSGTCETSTGQCRYNQETVACGQATTTCPDGFTSTCQQSCEPAGCKACAPSCEGHQTSSGNATSVCPSLPAPPCSGTLTKKVDAQGCVVGYECTATSTNATFVCPKFPVPPCPEGQIVTKTNADGCAYYECSPQTCAQVITPAKDAAGNCKEFPDSCLPPGWYPVDRCPERSATCGNNICEQGEAPFCPGGDIGACSRGTCPQDCQRSVCSDIYAPVCGTDNKTYSNDCLAKTAGVSISYRGQCGKPVAENCGNGICEAGEENFCRSDCISAREECPLRRTCAEGSVVQCSPAEFGGCRCDPCPENIPRSCRQEIDKERGFVRVVCEQNKCPVSQYNFEELRNKCEEKGGRFAIRKDFNSCEFPDCVYGGVSVRPVPVFNPLEERSCPFETEEQRESTRQSCEKLGLHFVITVQGDCKVSKCSAKQQEERCKPPEFEEKQKIEQECRQQGLSIFKDFDRNGCQIFRCGGETQCTRDVPKEAYEKCGGTNGGELVIRRNNQGCVVFSQCLFKGDIRATDVDPITEIPDSTELLSLVFRMEELKIQLDKLAKKTEDIANYYASVKSPDEERYRRVSDMFEAAKDKVEEIKSKFREIVDMDIKKDDLIEIKRDIRYIKDVMMKDILYLMLSSSDEVKEIKESRAVRKGDNFEEVKATDDTNCGTDDRCFDRAFRLCKKVIFYPEGTKGPKVEVRGLEGDACIMYAVMPEGEGPPAGAISGINPPYDMTCKITKYALGIRTPEEDVFPYCEGPMVELIKKFGTGGENAPGVPGKCSGDECRNYCGRGPADARVCLGHLGPYLPEDAKRNLEQMAEGNFNNFRRSGPGDEFKGFEGNQEFREQGFQEFSSSQEFRQDFNEFNRPPQTFQQGQACSGCLNNNVCDPGECSECQDCIRR